MSSPLLDQLRERRGLVYHADCSTDVRDAYGQFVIEASTMPRHLEAVFVEVTRLLRQQADAIDAVDLERARNQLAVRTLYGQEAADTRLELAALDLFALGRVRSQEERLAAIAEVTRDQVRDTFARMLAGGAAIGMAGKISKAKGEDVARLALSGSPAGGAIPCAS